MKTCGSCGEVYEDDVSSCPADGAFLHAWSQTTMATGDAVSAVTVGERPLSPRPKPPAIRISGLGEGRVLGGRYLLKKLMGVGGFGAVFEAEDQRLQKRVAVKILSPHVATNPDTLRRFQREALAATRIGHEGIVDVTDFDTDADGTHFLTMEYLDGRDLAHVIAKEGPLDVPRALSIALQVAEALAAAHDKGILHRDLKPANIYLTQRQGRADYVKILDFGISKMLHASTEPLGLTGTGQILGTPYYMAPEQASGERAIDGRADVYALGIILYEMLTKKLPFVGPTYLGVISQHLTRDPTPPSQSVEGASLGTTGTVTSTMIDELVLGALRKNPDVRFGSMAAFGAEIAQISAGLEPSLSVRPAPVSRVEGEIAMAPTLLSSPTGLSSRAGQTPEAVRPASTWRLRSQPRTPWVVLGLILFVGFLAIGMQRWRPAPLAQTDSRAPIVALPHDAASTHAPTQAALAPLPQARMIRISSPVSGAEVQTSDGGWRALPLVVPRPQETSGVHLPIRAVGHRSGSVLLSLSSPDEVTAVLHRVGGSKTRPPTRKGSIENEW